MASRASSGFRFGESGLTGSPSSLRPPAQSRARSQGLFLAPLVPLSQWSDVRCGGALDFASSEQRYITRIAIGERDRSYVGPRERILSRLIEKLRGSFRPSTVRTAERACVWRIADSGRMHC